MKKHISIFNMLLKINIARNIADKGNLLINSFLGDFPWALMSLLTVMLFTQKVPIFFGWSREEMIMLVGAANIFVGVFDTFFTRNFIEMFTLISTGGLDGILLKPVDAQFTMTFRKMNFHNFFRMLFGFGIITYIAIQMHLSVTLVQILISTLFLLAGILIIYSIWLSVCLLAIWNPDLDNLMHVLFPTRNFMRYPRETFSQLNPLIYLLILPMTFVLLTPIKTLLGKSTLYDVEGLFISCIGLLIISRMFFKFALRHYTSASS